MVLWRSLEYWSFEMVVLLSGLLPNPKLETSVLSIRSAIFVLGKYLLTEEEEQESSLKWHIFLA